MNWMEIALAAVVAASVSNVINCWILSRRIDTVHKRISLTLEEHGLRDFWADPDDAKQKHS